MIFSHVIIEPCCEISLSTLSIFLGSKENMEVEISGRNIIH